MKVTSYTQFLKNLKPTARNFFFYGSNADVLALRLYFLRRKLKQLHPVKFVQNDISHLSAMIQLSSAGLFDSISSQKVIHYYASNAVKSFDHFDEHHRHYDGFLIWQANTVYFQSPLVKAVDKHTHIAAIANYHLEAGELEFYIQQTFVADNIICDDTALQYIIDFHDRDVMALPSNLQNLILYALNGQPVTVDVAERVCQSQDREDIKACANAFLRGDQSQFLDTLANLGELSTMIIPLTRFISRMMQSSLSSGSASFQKNIRRLSLHQVTKILHGFCEIEQQIKSIYPAHPMMLQRQLCTLMNME